MALKSKYKMYIKMYITLFPFITYTFVWSRIPVIIEDARILSVETVGGKSHWNFMSSIIRALVDNKLNVTVNTPFTDENRQNYTEV